MNQPDPLEKHAPAIVDKLLGFIKTENEENAILCVKIFLDLFRYQSKILGDRIQPFLDIIAEFLESMDQLVKDTFTSPSQPSIASVSSAASTALASQSPRPSSPAVSQLDVGAEQQLSRPILKSTQSFKVIAEFPITVVSIFQVYRDIVHTNVKKFVPLIKAMLLLQAPPQQKAHADAQAKGTIFVGLSKDLKNRAAYGEFITVQVKTMSFLAYVMRAYANQLQDFLPSLPTIVVRLLRDCPKEKCSTRKELLVAIRHIVNFNFRKIFLKSIDDLLDERTLLGDGLAVYETQRPLAYSLLADLIHHLREYLSPEQIRLTVMVYTKNLRDPFPGTSFQTMSAKLLLNMADCIAKLEDKQAARYFLMAILDAIGDKFAYMNRQYPNAVKLSSHTDVHTTDISPGDYIAVQSQPPEWDEIDIFTTSPIKLNNPRDRGFDPVSDNKFLFKNLVHGLKNIIYQLRACNPPLNVQAANATQNWSEVASGFSAEEVQVLIKLFHEGIGMFQYYPSDIAQTDNPASILDLIGNQYMLYNKDEKELLETFANVFHHVDPAVFHEVFHSEIPHMYEMMFDHPALSQVPQFLLASEATSSSFAGMLLQFLMDRIEDVGSSNLKKASILLRLFKLSFMAVTLFSQHNEAVLLPHVNKLVTQSIRLSTTAEVPMHYFYLLRSLFRSIGGGRFEHLYKEILPLLEMLLEVLNNLICAARSASERDLYVELSLTVPARLSNLLPHLSYLMKPLVLALQAQTELVGQGLRTLELCVDNLTADYLDPIMAPVIGDLMAALYDHLQPSPYSHFHAHTTMRILGKLGGRNRRFLTTPPLLDFKPYADAEPQYNVKLLGATGSSSLPASLGVELAIAKLHETPKPSAAKAGSQKNKEEALKLIMAEVKLLIGADNLPDDFPQLVRLQADDLSEGVFDKGIEREYPTDREKCTQKRDCQQDILKDLLKALFFASSIPTLKDTASAFLSEVIRHFVILEVGRTLAETRQDKQSFTAETGEPPLVIDHRVLIDALLESLASEVLEVREAAEAAILAIRDCAAKIFGSNTKARQLPLFGYFLTGCCHSCHREDWYTKAGGILGIHIFAKNSDPEHVLLADKQVEICRALVFAAKDLPDDVPKATRSHALETLSLVIQRCSDNVHREDFTNTHSRIYNLCSFLVYELASTSSHVREAAQQSLAIIAELSSMEMHEIVAIVKGKLLLHIFSKPLRSVMIPIQVGYIDAIAFCIRLGNGILGPGEQLNRFLREAMFLADQDEDNLSTRPADQRNSENIVKLRVSCLYLLSLALEMPEFSVTATDARGRHRIVTVFFRCLYNKSTEVIDAANEALKVVVAQDPKLPKDILQSGLKPILVSLQDPSKLTLDGLDCLARLLQLLKNYFKVEIGTRLLDNIKSIADATVLQKASFGLVEQNYRIRIVAAIFNIFHLLPDASKEFMEKLVNKTIELEQQLRRTRFSPLRAPLVKYLNRFAKEAWEELFSAGIHHEVNGRFFAQILAEKGSGPLRDCLVRDVQRFTDTFSNDSPGRWVAIINAIHVTDSMQAYPATCKDFLLNDSFRTALLESGKALAQQVQKATINPNLRLPARQAGGRLMQILTTYIKQAPEDLDFLFKLVEAVTSQKLEDLSCVLEQCLYHHVISSKSVEYWRKVVDRCIKVYTSPTSGEAMKAFVIRNMVNPILAMDVMRNWDSLFSGAKGTEFVNKGLLESLTTHIWRPQATIDPSDESTSPGIDHSRMEMLQMTTLLLKYYHSIMFDIRKDIVRFSWVWIKLEDVINKHASYVVLAYFLAWYDAPAKIPSQILYSLVRAAIPEARALVVQALEVLAPALPKRLGSGEQGHPLPPWVRIARKPILEDPYNLQQTQNILFFVARHPELFYDGRESFAQMIIQNIYKIAQVPSTSLESKKSALNLISLILKWEQQSAQSSAATPGALSDKNASVSPESKKRKLDGTLVHVQSPKITFTKFKSFISSTSLRFMLIKYLVQFISGLTDRYPLSSAKARDSSSQHVAQATQSTEISKRAVDLLYSLLEPGVWNDLDIDAMFPKVTEGVLMVEPKSDDKYEMSLTRIINILQTISVMVNVKSDEWVVARVPQLRKLLEKPLKNPHPEVQDCLYKANEGRKPLIMRILEAIPRDVSEEEPEDAEQPAPDFVKFLSDFAGQCFTESNYVAGINILLAFSSYKPEAIDTHIPGIMKAQQHAVKEHLTTAQNAAQLQMAMAHGGRSSDAMAVQQQDSYTAEQQTDLVLKIIDLLASRMNQLGDHRRPYLSALTSLVDKSNSTAVCNKILDLVSSWIFTQNQGFPTVKERVAVVQKMISFEQRSDQSLFTRFLEMVIRIYEDSKITRSELAIRLEPAFLVGTRAPNTEMRSRFMTLFDSHISRTASKRILYLLAQQTWDQLQDSFWLSQVIELLFGSIKPDEPAILSTDDFRTLPASRVFGSYSRDSRLGDLMLEDDYESFMAGHRLFCKDVGDLEVKHILKPLCHLQHTDDKVAQKIWSSLFPQFWSSLAKDERHDLRGGLISLLTKDFHARQIDKRPNCVQALLEGIVKCNTPRMNFPHHLMKFLARTYNAWYTGLCFMEQSAAEPLLDTATFRESNLDALVETYASLQEEDLFYGLWRRRCAFLPTNTALSYEQHGEWDKAQRMYETATFKARTGGAPFSQAEYMLWEDHWVMCAQKLQQWDILTDFAKIDNLNDLYLESVWRSFDFWKTADNLKQLDNVIKSVSDAPTPRRAFFQAFMSLLKVHQDQDNPQAFGKITDEAIQLSIRKWHQLPKGITNAHIPILQNFQQLVELHDASVISTSLTQTTQANLEQKSPELKLLLSTWRDRLPNFWDDINAWQELVTWRQHIFQLINKKYLSLIPTQQGNVAGNSLAYRGYHEIAWTINHFAHVARKHNLPKVCVDQLTKIYTLPNIEIQEAFLKLREQAKCHYQNESELQQGLDVISNTNLNYFGQQQKAEFYTLKGMFLAKQKQAVEANAAFGMALYFDLKLPKAWAEWARYNDQLFKDEPGDISNAANAISCYLEAAGTYRSAKSRKFLSRVLWLLSLDDAEGTLAKAFEDFKGDCPTWYWITFIPQLLTSLSRQEARICRQILAKLAKQFPQALYFSLRVSREDLQVIKKQQEAKDKANASKRPASPQVKQDTPDAQASSSDPTTKPAVAQPAAANGDTAASTTAGSVPGAASTPKTEPNDQNTPNGTAQPGVATQPAPQAVAPKMPWEYTEEIVSVLKTAFPLLALSLESMVDQIGRNFKCPPDEDAYRLIVALLNDALTYVTRLPTGYAPGVKLPANTQANITRFAESVLPPHIRKAFEADFVTREPHLFDYIQTCRKWRDRFEEKLDRRRSQHNLETYGPVLSGFKFEKFDEVEIPGQYLQHKDNNKDFIRIERFMPDVDLLRGIGVSHRRLWIRGHDGSVHPFAVQHPAPRTSRREERVLQLCRFLNDVLAKRKESRRRQIQFMLPAIVPMTPSVRMVQDDPSYVTLQGIYENYCRRKRISKDEPVLFTITKLRDLTPVSPRQTNGHAQSPANTTLQRTADQVLSIRLNAFEAIQQRHVPKDLVLNYFQSTYPSFADFWLFRRQFAFQLAGLSFLTYILHMRDRNPSRMSIARASGNIWGSDLTPNFHHARPVFYNSEAVPFRLTPNLQMLLGPIALEGIFSSAILVIARALTEPDPNKLEQQLSVFIRDEINFHNLALHRGFLGGIQLRDCVNANGSNVMNRAKALAMPPAGGDLPANQSVLDLVAQATDPRKLCTMDPLWMPYL